ncbi:MAG: 4Fe-4S dicluster domain-containing protein [Candidatus Bathyarchaeota archaeon]|nr:MAG: 4Fe-4S dicluster domain-containing protein [Candidatus Bathyarchaeota archaeon]
MENSEKIMARVYIMGRDHLVPSGLTIMKAMEYVGYKFIRGAGCRGGFCGACATIYRMKNDYKLRVALACQETVKDGMFLAQIPFTPANKVIYDLDQLSPTVSVFLELYPEVAKCVSCNTCTKACPQDLEVMDYVQASLRGDFEKVAFLSFDCISCGLCAMRCPAEIAPHRIAELARRLYGKYIMPRAQHVEKRIKEIETGKYDEEVKKLMSIGLNELKKLYVEREIEK